jgi:hypothetical protein
MAARKLLRRKKIFWKQLCLIPVASFLLFIFMDDVYARDNRIRNGFMFGASLGYGLAEYSHQDMDASEGTFAFGLQAGYAITPNIILGLEVNGWTIEAFNYSGYCDCDYYDEPAEGESISNVSLFINVFPFNSPFYFTAGAGKGYYESYGRYEYYDDEGDSWFFGWGYEFPILERLMFAPQFRYSRGNFSDGNYSVTEISMAFRWYF